MKKEIILVTIGTPINNHLTSYKGYFEDNTDLNTLIKRFGPWESSRRGYSPGVIRTIVIKREHNPDPWCVWENANGETTY